MDRVVQITRGNGDLFMVTVCPPSRDHAPQLFQSHHAAKIGANGIYMAHRWPVQDLSEATL